LIDTNSLPRLLLFGGTGSIGSAINQYFQARGWLVYLVTRQTLTSGSMIHWDPLSEEALNNTPNELAQNGPFDAVCWAQGMNCSDSIFNLDLKLHSKVYQANVIYILSTLNTLLKQDLLKKPARLCVISSIWQEMARQNKLSYCVTKAALQGLVLSAAADLASEGHVINAVLPGVIDTPMTRANLSAEQINGVEGSTLFKRLPKLQEVASCVFDLCRPETTGITGQFIHVDLGYSRVRVI
jgi:hypothetical protein